MINYFIERLFSTIFYWTDRMEDSFIKLFPVAKDTVFSSVWGVAFPIAMNIFTLYGCIMILLECPPLFKRVDYILCICMAISYTCCYLYFQKSGRYKKYIRKIKINTRWNIITICYIVFSTYIAFFVVLWAKSSFNL